MPIQPAKNEADWARILSESQEKPVFLLKHSSSCPVSAYAWGEYQDFSSANPSSTVYMNLVIEDRPLARQIAAECGVAHASPQAILFRRGKAIWNASHGDITRESLEAALQIALAK